MKINGLTPVYFDIETTGFSAWEDSFVCATSGKQGKMAVFTDLEDLMNNIHPQDLDKHNDVLVTYNGENYRGGFDFPWLRSKCIQQGIEWQLGGVKHLDLSPLVDKYINTHAYGEFKETDFKAPDLKKLAKENGIDYQNKGQCLEKLKELEKPNWLDYKRKAKEDNSLQSVYQKLFDSEQEEEYISGEKIPELYEKMKANKDYPGKAEDIWQQIKDHNRRDVERLKKVAEAVIPVIPDWEIERNIKHL